MARNGNPGYREISKHYEHLIRSGELKPGQMLLKEPDLAKQHGVTRTTLRKAFAMLVNKGLIIKRRGQGTFVADADDVRDRTQMHVAVVAPDLFPYDQTELGGAFLDIRVSGCFYVTLEGITQALASYGRVFRVYHAESSEESPGALARQIRENGEIAIVGICLDTETIGELGKLGLPTVFVDSNIAHHKYDSVRPADREGVKQATLHVLKTTEGPLAFVGTRFLEDTDPHNVRYEGFLDAHREMGREFDERLFLRATANAPRGGRDAARKLLKLPELPAGIICSDDGLAFGLLDVFREKGVEVPGRTRVTGFGNSVFCVMTIPTITSVAPDRAGMGEKAIELLEERLKDPDRPAAAVSVPTSLKERQSTLPETNGEMPESVKAM